MCFTISPETLRLSSRIRHRSSSHSFHAAFIIQSQLKLYNTHIDNETNLGQLNDEKEILPLPREQKIRRFAGLLLFLRLFQIFNLPSIFFRYHVEHRKQIRATAQNNYIVFFFSFLSQQSPPVFRRALCIIPSHLNDPRILQQRNDIV